MKIKVTSVYVDDQDKALRFYTEVLGFAKKTDFSQRPISLADGGLARGAGRHRTATGAEQQPRGQSVSAGDLSTGPARGQCSSPTISRATTSGSRRRGAEFTMPPTDVTGSTIAMLKDTCGNLIQLTQLTRGIRQYRKERR